ncbi:MAG: low-complexity tail membrane protein [Cyanobacteriota bacterium]
MRSFWLEPFLWIHLAGLATVPIWLELCWLGLAVGDPVLPVWLELFLVATVGIAPVLWMQLSRPFNIFSILAVALKPSQLTLNQRRLLSQFKSPANQLVAVLAAGFMLWVLWLIYQAAPLAATVTPLPPEWRFAGLLVAALAFLASNLFLQIPLSVARVLLTNEAAFSATQPCSAEEIPQQFTIPGLQVNQILPPEISETSAISPNSVEPINAGIEAPASSD